MKSPGPLAGLFLIKNQSVFKVSQAIWQDFGPEQNKYMDMLKPFGINIQSDIS